MTYPKIYEMIQSIGLPCVYHHWEKGSVPSLPYIVFLYPSRNDFMADNRNYHKIVQVTIELYSDSKDFDAESKVEAVLEQNEIPYTKEEVYIPSERMYEVIYEMEVDLDA